MPITDSTFLKRVVISNYKSIASCDVALGPLTFLVGPNGAGKSNFLDVLAFVADALRGTLGQAIRDRGGIGEVRRRSSGHPTHVGMRLEFQLAPEVHGHYSFRLGALAGGGYAVQQEECVIIDQRHPELSASYLVRDGTIEASPSVFAAYASDRLYLVNVSGIEPYRTAFDALSRMGFYSFNLDELRVPQAPDTGNFLERDGWNIASVIRQMKQANSLELDKIQAYLSAVVAGVHGLDVKEIGRQETVEFRQTVQGSSNPWRFLAANMSEGTLRTLAVLVALYQSSDGRAPIRLVGIEEPEVALHPAAAGALRDSLIEASRTRQIIVTSHSPDLLDDKDVDAATILAVVAEHGETIIGPLGSGGRGILLDRLYTAGELLRMNQLTPEPQKPRPALANTLLFDRP
jgi:predicted ATPase